MSGKEKGLRFSVYVPERHLETFKYLQDNPDFKVNTFLVNCLVAKAYKLQGKEDQTSHIDHSSDEIV